MKLFQRKSRYMGVIVQMPIMIEREMLLHEH